MLINKELKTQFRYNYLIRSVNNNLKKDKLNIIIEKKKVKIYYLIHLKIP